MEPDPEKWYKYFLGDFGTRFSYEHRYGSTDSAPKLYTAVITDRGNFSGEGDRVAVKEIEMKTYEFKFGDYLSTRWTALLTLKHPNVVAFHQISSSFSTERDCVLAMFAMDYCNAGNLEQFIEMRLINGLRLDVKTLLYFSLQATQGLQFLHQNKIIHGDLKTSIILLNILSDNNMTLRIAGWDHCSKIQGSRSSCSDVTGYRGAVRFASPEMLLHAASDRNQIVGRKTDIWSLGCVIWDLARCCFDEKERYMYSAHTGEKLKIEEDGSFAFGLRYSSEEYVPCPTDSIPNDIGNEILRRCCDANVQRRPSADELCNMLVRIQELTYGTTWKYLPKALASTDEEATDTEREHRPTVESFGHACEYEIQTHGGFIAQGAFGSVYKATVREKEMGDYTGSRTVAVKAVKLETDYVNKLRTRNLWNAETARWQSLLELDHPNLVTFHKVTIRKILSGTAVEFMMDFCEGGNFATFIQRCVGKKCTLTESAIWDYILQVARGLDYLHLKRFILGDLKPNNILVKGPIDYPTSLLIGDLDGAVRIPGDTVHPEDLRSLTFTNSYMAPELAKLKCLEQHHFMDFRVDIWSLGCILLDLIECYLEVKDRAYWKNDAADIVYRQNCAAYDIALRLATGYVPYIPERTPTVMRVILQTCLNSDCGSRITSSNLLMRLQEINS